MPVTVHPAPHLAAREWSRTDVASSATALLKDACPTEYSKSKCVIQSSFQKIASEPLHPSNNGFVRAAVAAYCQHHHLTIRPEDVWFAILTQLSLFVNANAEAMRPFFVAHEGQKELWVQTAGNINSVDMGALARQMSNLLAKSVNDPELHLWIMPAFSTTTENDGVVASIINDGQRLEMLPKFGNEPTEFYQLLKPGLSHFVESFNSPKAQETKDFWQKIAHQSGGSGPHCLCGWITAFCFWDQDGNSMYARNGGPSGKVKPEGFGARNPGCQLGDTLYHKVDLDNIPSGCTSVPVKVDDKGTLYETCMVAGSVGIHATSSGGLLDESTHGIISGRPGLDSLQPESGWWMYELKEGKGMIDSTGQIRKYPLDKETQVQMETIVQN